MNTINLLKFWNESSILARIQIILGLLLIITVIGLSIVFDDRHGVGLVMITIPGMVLGGWIIGTGLIFSRPSIFGRVKILGWLLTSLPLIIMLIYLFIM